jgi:hypothetical protein
LADREGRLEDKPTKIHLEINAGRAFDGTTSALEWLEQNNFIDRYTVNDAKFIQVIKFNDHQNPHQKEAVSLIPAKPEKSTRKARGKNRTSTSLSGLIPSSLIPDSLIPSSLVARPRAFDPGDVQGLNLEAWNRWVEYRALRKPAIKAASMQAAAEEMAEFGADQSAVVSRCIAAGYQGLFNKSANGSGGTGRTNPQPYHRKTADELEAEEAAANAQH